MIVANRYFYIAKLVRNYDQITFTEKGVIYTQNLEEAMCKLKKYYEEDNDCTIIDLDIKQRGTLNKGE